MGERGRVETGRTGSRTDARIRPFGWGPPTLRGGLLLAGLVGMSLAAPAVAQDTTPRNPACDAEPFHQFDFWPGEWEVDSRFRLADGSWKETRQAWSAEWRVEGCILVDYASGDFGPAPMSGMGTRYYVPAQDHWVITWISTQAPGQVGRWVGRFENGVGDFISEGAGPVKTRIRWYDLERDSVRWEYAVSQDEGGSWTSQWMMHFRRAAPGGMN